MKLPGAAVGEVNTRFGLTGQALDDLSAKFIKFAQLNDTDVSTSIDNVSSVMNAFGMDASEADNLLDALNATGQATGIDMDTLANALSSNAAQLKEMGLTAQQAAGFMGMVEMSGLDTSAAMMGLKTAMKNATADGKTLDQVLAEFSATSAGGSGSDAEGQAAYDLLEVRPVPPFIMPCRPESSTCRISPASSEILKAVSRTPSMRLSTRLTSFR